MCRHGPPRHLALHVLPASAVLLAPGLLLDLRPPPPRLRVFPASAVLLAHALLLDLRSPPPVPGPRRAGISSSSFAGSWRSLQAAFLRRTRRTSRPVGQAACLLSWFGAACVAWCAGFLLDARSRPCSHQMKRGLASQRPAWPLRACHPASSGGAGASPSRFRKLCCTPDTALWPRRRGHR